MKKRARICFYIFLFCAFVALSIGGYFLFNGGGDNVRVGKKFVTFNQTNNASSYKVSVQTESGELSTSDVIYKVNKTERDGVCDYSIEVYAGGENVARESYTQKITRKNEENTKIDCVISNYTIFFLKTGQSNVYPDQKLYDVDSNIFCCVVSDYFDSLFVKNGSYTLFCSSMDSDGNVIEQTTYSYDYKAYYEEDFLRRSDFFYDGVWYDYVIESREELSKLVWWTLLYRQAQDEDLTFFVKTEDINEFNINNLVIDSINNYPEYDALEDSRLYAKLEGQVGALTSFEYYLDENFLLTYKDLKNLNIQGARQAYNYALTNLHYLDESYSQGYITRDGTERTFAVDSVQDEVVVYNTEQLFMVVQSGARPVFVEGESDVALAVYQNALNVLRRINNSDYLTDFEKVTNIYRYITGEIVYDYTLYAFMEAENDYSIKNFGNFSSFYLEGVFYDFGYTNHYAVCDGLSKAFSLMCNIEGIDCIKINGVVKNGNHAWNRVYLSDENLDGWYYVDTTWGEGNYVADANYQILTHTYFLFDFDDSYREITYPERLEEKSPSSTANYYQIVKYSYDDEINDFYIESDADLQNVFEYAESMVFDDEKYVLEVQFSSDYLADVDGEIYYFLDLQNQIETLEKRRDRAQGMEKMSYQFEIEKLKQKKSAWFVENGITDTCEWLKIDNTIIFKITK